MENKNLVITVGFILFGISTAIYYATKRKAIIAVCAGILAALAIFAVAMY